MARDNLMAAEDVVASKPWGRWDHRRAGYRSLRTSEPYRYVPTKAPLRPRVRGHSAPLPVRASGRAVREAGAQLPQPEPRYHCGGSEATFGSGRPGAAPARTWLVVMLRTQPPSCPGNSFPVPVEAGADLEEAGMARHGSARRVLAPAQQLPARSGRCWSRRMTLPAILVALLVAGCSAGGGSSSGSGGSAASSSSNAGGSAAGALSGVTVPDSFSVIAARCTVSRHRPV